MGHFQQHAGVFNFIAKMVAMLDQIGKPGLFLEHFSGFVRIIPEIGPGTEEFQFF
jgi:hypothetical protein